MYLGPFRERHESTYTMSSVRYITPEKLVSRYMRNSELLLIDVRTKAEHRSVRVPRSLLLPPKRLAHTVHKMQAGGTGPKEIFLLCRTGEHAREVAVRYAIREEVDVFVVEGGILAWEEAGLPVVSHQITRPRIYTATGSLLLLGTGLGFYVHRVFWIIPTLVGGAWLLAGLLATYHPDLDILRRRR